MANTNLGNTVSSAITPGDASTLATWVAALAETNADVVVTLDKHQKIEITPKCTTDNADITLILYRLSGSTWAPMATVDWSGFSTYNPAANDYRLPPAVVTLDKGSKDIQEVIAIGKTAGTGTWTVFVRGIVTAE